jgi:hypothetical protein
VRSHDGTKTFSERVAVGFADVTDLDLVDDQFQKPSLAPIST